MMTAVAPSCSSMGRLLGFVVVAVTWWPRATSCGTSCRPTAPEPPATNSRMMVFSLVTGVALWQPRSQCT